ncbi:tyrosinase family protein [Bradyrhizobium sp. AUGA SZCCT0240]|jgi:tyrosinase|uniref:tyrosinase family protein n=1 Tax=unclassified Bradyrhizobium TaxID=2631580 RepID=UPI001BA93503|nr:MULTISPECIES: tyrosinase family protein [unclassified Bradyrhizobium]MBR1195810.1 tyrosinase family protein [Bradyrhizobium sp. AUGA SZCCT0158]MBR1240209.1 tyrosinase family protein [Bradyrhizobium sp. AUGA SZCCT0274]MBR1250946.1 tyrosinase family protein [Bradyrhizobium sp. AUGA SZCCT0169]MBR1256309.1 tyrosinase family protein [Bradyrhizobium sp. AUGA SZCCT0240]
MDVELQINNGATAATRFVSWAPSPCRIRVTNPSGATSPTVNVTIAGVSSASGGVVVFRAGATGSFANSLTLPVPTNGTTVPFFVAGRFGRPSVNNGDVKIEARVGATLVGSVSLMVRIRKNANALTAGERDRFVSAFAQLNNQGLGRFADFRNMHTNVSSPQAHGAPGFLPWHRAYLLDLERELQAIDPSVALPYWRFDQAAPRIFNRDFLGVSNALGTVQFNATNPLQFWKTDGVQGINRRPFFSTTSAPPGVRTEPQTLALGTQYAAFQTMEGNPHGSAHTSFGGSIASIGTAAKDPLFFLLHCNVDRLWAKWQRQNGRFNPALAASFANNGGNPIGHNLPDTMWPWNGITGGQRPPTAPGGSMAPSPCVSAPGLQPRVQSSLDYQGTVNATSRMGFDYDDVQF